MQYILAWGYNISGDTKLISCDSGLGLKYALIFAAVVSEVEIIQQQSIASLMRLST